MYPLTPRSEAQVISLFRSTEDQHGWRFSRKLAGYPDALVSNPAGQELRAEFEYQASAFKGHGHDPAGCDVIICWRNNWPDSPLPVLALEDALADSPPTWEELQARASQNGRPYNVTGVVNYRGVPAEVQARVKGIAAEIGVPVGEVARFFLVHGIEDYDRGTLCPPPVRVVRVKRTLYW